MPIEAIHQFPKCCLGGCATAAHQVEGQNSNDWCRWEETPGHIFEDQQSGRACDWWAGRYLEDFDRAVDMHNNSLRLSIEWSRIEPEPEQWNDDALARYREMLQALRNRGLTPMVTLHHFTHPLWVMDRQGWQADDMPQIFERYVRKVMSVLGDLCSLWCTINEPAVYLLQGYSLGLWPPGLKNRGALNRATLNLVRGHARAYRAIKELQPQAQVGFATHHTGFIAESPVFINNVALHFSEHFSNRTFPLAFKDGLVRLIGARSIKVPEAAGTLDWIGLQYYQEYTVGFNTLNPSTLFIGLRNPPNMPSDPKQWGALSPDGRLR